MASSPIVGNNKKGVGENTNSAVLRSGLFITLAIGPAKQSKNNVNTAPRTKNIFVTLEMISREYSVAYFGRK